MKPAVPSNPIIETQRFWLRLFEESETDELFALYADPDVSRFLPGERTREIAEQHIAKFAKQYDESGFTLWAVQSRLTGELVGRVGLWPLDDTNEVELGYVVARADRGTGVATETSKACLKYGFEQLGLSHIVALSVPDNEASKRVLQKLGFQFVRRARYYQTDVLYYRLERTGN